MSRTGFITWVNIENRKRTYGAKFRSGNLLENGNKNRWNLQCGELLLSLICTRSLEKNSLLHLSYIATLLCRKDEADYFSPNFVCVLRTTTTHHIVSFIDFYFHFLANFQTQTSRRMFSIFTHVMKPVRDTNNEPGWHVLRRGLPVEYSYSIKNSFYLKKWLGGGSLAPEPTPCAGPVKANGITTHCSGQPRTVTLSSICGIEEGRKS